MHDHLCRHLNRTPHCDWFETRNRSPLRICEVREESAKIDSLTNVHRKYLLYSSESRCVHLFEEKVTRYVRPVRRYKSDKLRQAGIAGKLPLPPTESSPVYEEPKRGNQRYSHSSDEQAWNGDTENKSVKSRSYHGNLNTGAFPDLTSPRFMRPCRRSKIKCEEDYGTGITRGPLSIRYDGNNRGAPAGVKVRYEEAPRKEEVPKETVTKEVSCCKRRKIEKKTTRTYVGKLKRFIRHLFTRYYSVKFGRSTMLLVTLMLAVRLLFTFHKSDLLDVVAH